MKFKKKGNTKFEERTYHMKPNVMLKFNSDGNLKRISTHE